MRGVELKNSETKRDLGIHVDDALKFRKQAATAAPKANPMLGVIRRLFKLIDATTLPTLQSSRSFSPGIREHGVGLFQPGQPAPY